MAAPTPPLPLPPPAVAFNPIPANRFDAPAARHLLRRMGYAATPRVVELALHDGGHAAEADRDLLARQRVAAAAESMEMALEGDVGHALNLDGDVMERAGTGSAIRGGPGALAPGSPADTRANPLVTPALPNDLRPMPARHVIRTESGSVYLVERDGTIHTVEGNSSDQVAQRTYAPGSRPAIGYVRLG